MKRFLHAAALCALLPVFPTTDLSAQTTEATLDKIARTGEFLIGYRTDSNPLSFQDAGGEPSGYSVDICRRVADSVDAHFSDQDIETKFVRISSNERIEAVVSGQVDIECGSTTITLSRQEQVDFSLPTFVTGGSVMSLTATGIRGMSDLSGKTVGVAKGTTTVEQLRNYLDENGIDAKIVVVEDRFDGMKRLNLGKIDALASDQIVLIGYVAEAKNPQQYTLVSEIFSYEPYGLMMRRNDADFRLLVNRAISGIYRSGQHADIYYDWIGKIGVGLPPILAAMYQLNAHPE